MTHDETARSVILHASDAPADVARATDAARELRRAHPELAVRVIVNGDALAALTDGTAVAAPDGVQVQACSTGLARRNLDPVRLPDTVGTVPAAVTAIVEAQLAGAVYVRI